MKATLTEALFTSGKVLMAYFEGPLTHTIKESKSSIVTEADFASDAAIKKIIAGRFTDHNIISEETGFIDNGSEYTWVIDPLDGTSNFAAGIPWFGVLITLLKGDQPEMAGAFIPATGDLYFATRGEGAFRNDMPMKPLLDKSLGECLFAFCVDYTDDSDFLNRGLDMYRYIAQNSRNIRSTNCLLDFIYAAEGKFGGVLNLFTRAWDVAGLSLIIQENGGLMRNIDGSELRFKPSATLSEVNFPVIAGNRQIVNEVGEKAKSYFIFE
jgi:myo-inositol-1(or 4)-monophosphatase